MMRTAPVLVHCRTALRLDPPAHAGGLDRDSPSRPVRCSQANAGRAIRTTRNTRTLWWVTTKAGSTPMASAIRLISVKPPGMKASRSKGSEWPVRGRESAAERQRDQQHDNGRACAEEERAPDQCERGAGEAGADRAAEHELRDAISR